MKKNISKKLYKKITLSILSITLIISLSACGKKSEDISDYGNQNKATNSDVADDVSGYGSLRDKLGTDTINWQETVSAGGIDYKFNIVYDVPDMENVPVYIIMLISDIDKMEKELVENIFKDGFEEVHEISKDEESDVADVIFSNWYNESELGRVENTDAYIDYEEAVKDEDFFNSWNKYGNFSLHTYKGMYEGTEYYAVFSRYEDGNYIVLRLIKDNISDFMGNDDIIGYTYYSNNVIPQYLNSVVYKDEDNAAFNEKEQLADKAISFLNNSLGSDYYIADTTDDLAFYGYTNDGLYGTDIIELNGYRLELKNKVLENGNYEGTKLFGYFRSHESECIEISSKGIIYMCIGMLYEDLKEKSSDTNMLSFESIKNVVKNTLENEIDVSRISINHINIDKIALRYYPVVNPDNESEFTLIPVWWLHSSTKSFGITINAVDGSVVSINY